MVLYLIDSSQPRDNYHRNISNIAEPKIIPAGGYDIIFPRLNASCCRVAIRLLLVYTPAHQINSYRSVCTFDYTDGQPKRYYDIIFIISIIVLV